MWSLENDYYKHECQRFRVHLRPTHGSYVHSLKYNDSFDFPISREYHDHHHQPDSELWLSLLWARYVIGNGQRHRISLP